MSTLDSTLVSQLKESEPYSCNLMLRNEFRQLLSDLQDYRRIALGRLEAPLQMGPKRGLIAQHLHHSFQNKRILCAFARVRLHLNRSSATYYTCFIT